MITGELKSKIDSICDTIWSGGISNPLTVIEQLTYLLFIKRLDELHTLKERKASRAGKPMERKRTDKSFFVPKEEIRQNGYDLSINRYKEVEYEAVEYDPPNVILARLAKLDEEIAAGRKELGGCYDEDRNQ
jgi:type I restriction-modification system DNA methylase subunit